MKIYILLLLLVSSFCRLDSPNGKIPELALLNGILKRGGSGQCQNTGTQKFTMGPNMITARASFTSVKLNDGKILVAGGLISGYTATAKAEIYDPKTNSFTAISDMKVARAAHTATLLQNGKVMIAGGRNSNTMTNTTEIYDPTTGTFTLIGNMNGAKASHTATLFSSGLVLIVGGMSSGSPNTTSSAKPQLYYPDTNQFSDTTGSMITSRYDHSAVLLNNGNVLITAGSSSGGVSISKSEMYNLSTGLFTSTSDTNNSYYGHKAILLENGKVLIMRRSANTKSEQFDPNTGDYSIYSAMISSTYFPSIVKLSDNRILITGGSDGGSGGITTSEIFNPATEAFTITGSLNIDRGMHSGILLDNCKVLIMGGGSSTAGSYVNSTEIYDP